MTINQIVQEQKRQGEETEFYPTTQEIVNCVAEKLKDGIGYNDIESILDIGCGNGNFFSKLELSGVVGADRSKIGKWYKKYGIEKSHILYEQLPEDVIVLGTDFDSQTLLDKKVDVIFCNPPYSVYDSWSERIIKESNCKAVVLVIPCRWKTNERINFALKQRKYQASVLGTFDFYNAERKARATVDVLWISPEVKEFNGHTYSEKPVDPFELWFDETFKINADKEQDFFSEKKQQEEKTNEIISSGDTVDMLLKFYNDDMQKLANNYRSLENLDAELFKELHIDTKTLKESLKKRLQGLKHYYWDLLFKKYDSVTKRLSSAGRKKVIQRLQDNTAIDFTLENIYQLTMWIIRHSNTLFDEQITDFFYSLCDSENIHRYKSNLRWNDDDWRYLKEDIQKAKSRWCSHSEMKEKIRNLKNIQLDYRIVCTGFRNFSIDWSETKMTEECINFLTDIQVIARNLGFDVTIPVPANNYVKVNMDEWKNFDVELNGELFCNVKLYQNGNRHLKFSKKFMQKLNIEMARINHWVTDKKQAQEEFGLSEDEIDEFWKSNIKIEITDGRKLLGLPQQV